MFEPDSKSPMDLREGRLIQDSAIDRLEGGEDVAAPEEHELDSEENRAIHSRLMSFYLQELDRQSDNRREMAVDEDFYDNVQWSPEDAAALHELGQMPIAYNVISPTLDWVFGTEKRGRTDFRILPRRKDASKPAERKTQLLKYLSDVNRSTFHRSRAFEEAVKVGVGWLECGVQDDDDGEPIYMRSETWRNVLWDSSSFERDLSDGRYQFRSKWVDLDIAVILFPERKAQLELAAVAADRMVTRNDYGDEPMDSAEELLDHVGHSSEVTQHKRKRVRLIEAWFRKPTQAKRLQGGEFAGEVYDEAAPQHQEAEQSGQSVVVDKVMLMMHVAIMTEGDLMFLAPSPYRHNKFPLTPIWGYRRGRTGLPYGMIRRLRDLQIDINKRASKALAILSSNKVLIEEGAVDDIDEFAEEVSRPNAVLVYKAGRPAPVIGADRELGPAHLDLMSRSIAMVQAQGGVTDENMGRSTNATSGIAIQARQDQGLTSTTTLFDNLRYAVQVHGEKELSLVEQYYDEQKQFRITNMRGTPEYITVNDGTPENDIVRSKADFIISEQDWRASVRQAQVEELLNLMGKLVPVAPQIGIAMIDLLVEGMDLPNGEELVKRIRQVTGMRDPDAEEPSPEEMAQMEKAAQVEAMQKAGMEAEIADKTASAALKAAQARKASGEGDAIFANVASKNVAAQKTAMETGVLMLQAPGAIPAADAMLHEAGFAARSELERTAEGAEVMEAEQAAMAEQAMAEQAAMAPMPPQPQQQPRGLPA